MMRTVVFAGIALLLATAGSGQEQAQIEILKSDAPVAAKAAACRALKTIGTADSVAAIAPLLSVPELSHDARIALEAMPYAEASTALRNAVGATEGALQAGILDSIGERRDQEAVDVVAAALADGELRVVASAALALGKIGTIEAARQLEQAYANAAEDRRVAIGDGRLRCAAGLQQAGLAEEAAAIFGKLSAADEPAVVRGPALLGLLQTAGDKTLDRVRRFLAADDPMMRAAAAAFLPYLPPTTLRSVMADSEQLPVASRLAVLAAVRLSGDSALAPAAIAAARSEDSAVAQAGMEAVAMLAGSRGLEVLLPIATTESPLAEPAWRAIEALRGAEVDAKLAAALPGRQNPEHRVRLIRALAARNASGSVPVLLDYVGSDNGDVRAASAGAIVRLAMPAHVPAIVTLMLQTPRGADRDTLEKAVMLALDDIADADRRTAAVLAGVDLQSDAQRVEFLPLLGRIGGDRALGLVQAALSSSNADIYEAGVRAIANWPDAGPVGQLADLAQNARENHQRIWALRAMIRVSALPGTLPDDRKLALLRRAMEMAARDDERSLAIQRAGAIRTVESLRFAAAYLDHASLAPAACRAVVELAHHKELRDPNRDAFVPALRKVIAVSSDAGVVDRAKRYLQELGELEQSAQ